MLLTGCISVSCILFIPIEVSSASTRDPANFFSKKEIFSDQGERNQTIFQINDAAIDKQFKTVSSLENKKTLNEAPFLELEIIADSQYWEGDNLFVAEGNVKALLENAILQADKIQINKSKKIILATGNVSFRKGSQYFSANRFEYDLVNKLGTMNDVYGVIDVKLIPKDLNLYKSKGKKENSISAEDNQLREIKLEDGFIIQGGFSSEMENIEKSKLENNSINKWRIKASKILLENDLWKAQKVSFTNDPFNPAQTKIDSYEVEVKVIKDVEKKVIITAKKSYLIVEDKFKLPIGNRKFVSGKEKEKNWVLGFDGTNKDGLFIGRQLRPIQLSDSYKLFMQPQYLIQRSIKGETDAYPVRGGTILSKKVSASTNYSDLFGLEAQLQGSILNWDNNFEADISTFNNERFANGARYSGDFKKKFNFAKVKDLEAVLFGLYRYQIWNGSLGSSDIYTAYGARIDKEGKWANKKKKFEYNVSTSFGTYQGENLAKTGLIELLRVGIISEFDIKYPLNIYNNKDKNRNKITVYSPRPIEPGFSIDTNIISSYFNYENGNNQSSFEIGLGPSLTIGSFTRNYLDYTKLSLMPSITFKGGDSPFAFDNINDLAKLKVNLSQQLIGPIVIKNIYHVNIDSDSSNYGKTISWKSGIILQRRSYEIGLSYDFKNQSGGFNFRLNGFNYKGNPLSF
ncbi:Repeats containing protein [Prochlorococcus marinus subsp. marinus str. CCMP1375]|uniref:Repeats containing protein n=1 Tax=Prochlorococcus marinus (strain SARG / CCMP1375 / SS120) TaxID=167539 RepID=Q7VDT2_PROMA|nr:DUF3769 domain-containing protein [Prochlorococcus marinus]AAP99332.1 Repeats containing protein [Prochlorococcus marinus subsp. marinus str. CCMP1375]